MVELGRVGLRHATASGKNLVSRAGAESQSHCYLRCQDGERAPMDTCGAAPKVNPHRPPRLTLAEGCFEQYGQPVTH